MTPKELLNPRVISIAEDTSDNFVLDEIFHAEYDGRFYFCNDNCRWSFDPYEYPHLFRKLDWWEERNINDMPKYVKHINESVFFKVKTLRNNQTNEMEWGFVGQHMSIASHCKSYLPATESEYNQYIIKITIIE